MLYIIGGAPRSGKSILSQRILEEKHIAYFPLDALVSSLLRGAPELNVHHNQSFIKKSEGLWKFSRPLFTYLMNTQKNYLVEGDSISPKQVKELCEKYPDMIKACFLGYADLSPEEKLGLIRKFSGSKENDWTHKHSDEVLSEMISGMIGHSVYLKQECEILDLKYFDVSRDFEGIHEEIYKYLFK